MRKNKKGFTLIEMLAVVILLAILMAIAVGSYYSYIKKSRDDSFKIAENTIQNDVKNAYADCLSNSKNEFCINHSGYGEKNDKIYLKELIDAGYSEQIKNPYDTNSFCDTSASYVTVIGNNTDNNSSYLTCLVCGDKKSNSCENATIYVDTNGLTATITMEDEQGVVGYGINQSEENEPSYISIGNLKKVVKSYTSEKEGEYYVWVKNTLGNVSKAKFTLHSAKNDTIYFLAKEATYTGNPIEANIATSESGTLITYTYYNGTSCSGSKLDSAPIEPGNYSVKAVSRGNINYLSASKCVTHTILRSVPTLVLKEKSATYTGKPIKANKVEATNPNGSSVELAYTYRYYKDNSCSVAFNEKTPTEAPIEVGTYYVKATSAQTSTLGSMTTDCVKHTITEKKDVVTLSKKEVVYNGKEVVANKATSESGSEIIYFYYANTNCSGTALTTAPTNVGTYYVKATSKATDNLNSTETECIQHNITKKVDVITLENKNASYTGSEISHNLATSESKTAITYTYYSSSDCTGEKLTSLPVNVGFYSIKAESKGNSNYASGNKCSSHIITKGTPTISLLDKTMEATGSSITIGEATATNPNGSNVDLEYSYIYYSGTSCSEAVLDNPPTNVGEYSAKAVSKVTSNLKSGTSNCSLLKITPNTNNYLKNFGVNGYTITPSFSSTNSLYNLEAEIGIKNVSVVAEAMSVLSTVSGTGSKTLSWGNNDLIVYVTSQSGSVRTYKITLNNVRPTAPTLTGGSNSWVATASTIKVATAGTALSKVKEYEYYKSTSNTAPTEDTTITGTTSDNLTVSDEGTTYVWYRTVSNNGNRSTWSDLQVVYLDVTKPIHTNWWWGEVTKDVAKLYIQATDNVGIAKVQCPTSTATGSYNNWNWFTATWDSSANAYRCDITPATFGHYNQTYKTQLYIYDQAGNGGYYNQTTVNIPPLEQKWEYAYTGGSQSFTAPFSGTYKLEVWGAEGGTRNYKPGVPGKGGYSSGKVKLTQGQVLYVYVGGNGGYGSSTMHSGGFNGGGQGLAAGGGATHIGTRNGTIAQYGNTTGLLIVAGGGGAAGWGDNSHNPGGGVSGAAFYGGNGGGSTGSQGCGYHYCGSSYDAGNGGTQSNGGLSGDTIAYGTFGAGGYDRNGRWWSGGGGGLYGGGGGDCATDDDDDWMGGGGGGSGYIGGVTDGSMQNGVRSGNGYAKITLVSTN